VSTIVTDILTNAKSTISTTLGASYQELRFVYDVSKNDLRAAYLAYGMRPLSATTADSGTVRAYTLDQGFEIILLNTSARPDSDAEKTTAIGVMYDKCDEIFKALVNSKAGVPSYVLVVNQPSISEPEFLEENKVIVLRMQLNIRYRSTI
jgi:hypothetical protein